MNTLEWHVCRCCLHITQLKSLFEENTYETNTMSYGSMLNECFSLDVIMDDNMPQWICAECCIQLKTSYDFKLKAIQSFAILSKQISTNDEKYKAADENYIHIPLDKIKEEDMDYDVKDFEIPSNKYEECDNKIIYEEAADIKMEYSGLNEFSLSDDELLNTDKCVENNSDAKEMKLNLRSRQQKKFNTGKKNVNIQKSVQEPVSSIAPLGEHQTWCSICGKHLRTTSKLRDHINWVHLGIKYYCEICKKYYLSEWRHKSTAHRLRTEKHWRTCTICSEVFKLRSHFTAHMMAKHGASSIYNCQCGEQFDYKIDLDRHSIKVHKERNYVCQFCSKAFGRQDKLNLHIRTHTKERPSPCPHCELRFADNSQLKKHLERHLKEKKVVCDYCSRKFKTKSDLRYHIKRHDPNNNHKKYACAVCGKRFHRSDHRNNHQNNVHKLKPAPASLLKLQLETTRHRKTSVS